MQFYGSNDSCNFLRVQMIFTLLFMLDLTHAAPFLLVEDFIHDSPRKPIKVGNLKISHDGEFSKRQLS